MSLHQQVNSVALVHLLMPSSCLLQERRRKTRHQPVRRSGRLNGSAAEYGGIDGDDCCTGVTYSDYEPGLKDLLAGRQRPGLI